MVCNGDIITGIERSAILSKLRFSARVVADVRIGGRCNSSVVENELAVSAGIPGKMGTSGDDVAGMWLGGKWREIVQYNCYDALTTYLVWLRTAHLAGFVTDEDYECEQMVLQNMLLEEAEKPDMAFLNAYVEEWNRLQEA